MQYSIGAFSQLTGLSIHTLRYYEHEKLIIPARTSGNRRCYSDRDLAWTEFVLRLKDTGMSIQDIRRYAELRTAGDSTLRQRMHMLIQHRCALNKQMTKLQEHQSKLDEKIRYYETEIARICENTEEA